MLIHPMAERLRGLGLAAMADAFLDMHNQSAADDLSREDWLGLPIDREVTARDNKRLGRRLNLARLRQNAVVEDADLRTPRGLDRGLFQTLTTCGWIRDSHHVLNGGPTGVGKSWLACALGHKACRDGFSVLYRRAPRLFADLATARGEGRLARLMRSLERTRLLIIDDWGPEPLVSGGENPRIDGAALLDVWRPLGSKAKGPNRLRRWRCNVRPEEGAIAALRFDRRARGQAAMAPFRMMYCR